MNVLIRWHNNRDNIFGSRHLIYDLDKMQDYAISGPNQMWYKQVEYLGYVDSCCTVIWVNDEVVYNLEDFQDWERGWQKDSYWYKEMRDSIKKEREFREITEALQKTPRILYSR